MTEKTGGSDVSGTETIAKRQPDGTYALHGYKVERKKESRNKEMLL